MTKDIFLISPIDRVLSKEEIGYQLKKQAITFDPGTEDITMLIFEYIYSGINYDIKQAGFSQGSTALWFSVPLNYILTLKEENKNYDKDTFRANMHTIARNIMSAAESYVSYVSIVKPASIVEASQVAKYISPTIFRFAGPLGIAAGVIAPFFIDNHYVDGQSLYDQFLRDDIDKLFQSIKKAKDQIVVNKAILGQIPAMRVSAMELAREIQKEFNLTEDQYKKLWQDLFEEMKQTNKALSSHKISSEEADDLYFSLLEDELEEMLAKKEEEEAKANAPNDINKVEAPGNEADTKKDVIYTFDADGKLLVDLPQYITFPLPNGYPDPRYYSYNALKNRFELLPVYKSSLNEETKIQAHNDDHQSEINAHIQPDLVLDDADHWIHA